MNIARQRLVNQRLIDRPFEKAADAVSWFGAVQAQDYPNAKYGVALRMRSATDASISRAFDAGEIVRTHVLRPTWHFIAADDVRWLVAFSAPRIQAANARLYAQFELSGAVLKKAHAIIAEALAGRQYRTRAELAALLEARRISAYGQRGTFIVMHAELAGLICSGPVRGRQHTYALLDERVPRGHSFQGDEALAELARRYFTSHGPATPHDFAWWSGQTVGAARRAIEMLGSELESDLFDGKTYWRSGEGVTARLRAPAVQLLPNYDEHVVAYRDHGPSVDPRAPDALYGWGNGLTPHLVVLNGLVIGGWRRKLEPDRIVAVLTLPVRLSATERKAFDRATQHYSDFMELPVVYASKQIS